MNLYHPPHVIATANFETGHGVSEPARRTNDGAGILKKEQASNRNLIFASTDPNPLIKPLIGLVQGKRCCTPCLIQARKGKSSTVNRQRGSLAVRGHSKVMIPKASRGDGLGHGVSPPSQYSRESRQNANMLQVGNSSYCRRAAHVPTLRRPSLNH